MVSRKDSNVARVKRHKRVRAKVSGTASRPRLCVYRSENNIQAQIIDDVAGVTLCTASTYESGFEDMLHRAPDCTAIGELLGWKAEIPLEQIIRDVAKTTEK